MGLHTACKRADNATIDVVSTLQDTDHAPITAPAHEQSGANQILSVLLTSCVLAWVMSCRLSCMQATACKHLHASNMKA
jgi:BarA-like signal transduction histidine kinase